MLFSKCSENNNISEIGYMANEITCLVETVSYAKGSEGSAKTSSGSRSSMTTPVVYIKL